jgi:hypothetical protein
MRWMILERVPQATSWRAGFALLLSLRGGQRSQAGFPLLLPGALG